MGAHQRRRTFTRTVVRDLTLDVYSDMTDKDQAALLETLGGKRGGQVVAAIMRNWDAVDNSLNTVRNSAGNAMKEMDIIYQSLDYKLNALKETGTGIWQNLFQRDDIGFVIDGLTTILGLVDSLTENIGLFGTIAASAGIGAMIKSIA